MPTFHRALFTGLLCLAACQAGPMAEAPTILPLRTLRLYETGVGYFERTGTVSAAGASTSLPVPAGHLDDALKSLVILSQGGRLRVSGLEFKSSVSKGMGRALAGLPAQADGTDGPIQYRDILAGLKGAHVEVRLAPGAPGNGPGEMLSGRLVDVISPEEGDKQEAQGNGKNDDKKAPRPEGLTLLLLTDRSEVRPLRSTDVLSVRPTDPAFASRLGSALDALSQHGAQNRRLLRLLASNNGPVTFGYIAETPLWRTTYRLVLSEGGRSGVLQGWALLHNDADEDWHGVRVQLVNGQPDSFLFPLAAPRYTRRQLVHPDNELSTVPQLLDTTVDAIWGDHVEDGVSAGSLGLTGHGSGGGSVSYGSGRGNITAVGHGAGASSLLKVGDLSAIVQSDGVESGALFSYTLAEPLDLRAHGSALVPFLQRPVEVEEITWIASPGQPARSAVRFVNTTGQTLPAGPIAIFGDGGFSGESSLDRLLNRERRFIQFGADLDVEVSEKHAEAREETRRLVFHDEVLSTHYLRHSSRTYEIENRSGRTRTVVVSLPINRNAEVKGADQVDFDMESSRPVIVIAAAPRSKAERMITAVEGLSRDTALLSLESSKLSALSSETGLSQKERSIATEAAARQRELESVHKDVERTKGEIAKLDKDIARWQEHLKAQGGDKGAGESSFARRILQLEDQLGALRRKQEAGEGELLRRRDAVRKVLERLVG